MQARPPSTAVAFGRLVAQVGRRLSRQVEHALSPAGLTLDQWRVLDLLADGAGHAMSEIAAHAMVPAPTLTKIVDRLVESALVYRRPDDTDRRRVLVLLSQHGRQVHDDLAPTVQRAETDITDELHPADLAHLVRLLQHLAQ